MLVATYLIQGFDYHTPTIGMLLCKPSYPICPYSEGGGYLKLDYSYIYINSQK